MVDLLLDRGLPGPRDRQPGRRAGCDNLRAPQRRAALARRRPRHPRARAGRPALRRAPTTSSTSPASATSCPRSTGRPTTCRANVHGHGPRAGGGARTPGCGSSSTPPRPPATGWRRSCRPPSDAPIRPAVSLRAEQVPGRAGGAALGHRSTSCRSSRIRIFNAYGPRSRTTGAYGAVFGVFLAQKLGRQAVHRRGRRHPAARLRVTSPTWRAPSLAAAEHRSDAGDLTTSGRATRSGQPAGRAARRRGRPRAEAARRAGLHLGRHHARFERELGWEPRVSFEEGVAEMLRNIDYWREAPVWDPASIEEATQAPGSHAFEESGMTINDQLTGSDSRLPAEDQDARGAARRSSAPAARRARSSCATAPSTSCIPATSAI